MKPSRADEPLLFAEAWRFGDVRIDPGRHVLQVRADTVEIEPKPFALLIALAEARGDVVDKRDLLERLWPRQIVTDAVLNQCVLRARQAIGDDDHRMVVTVHRRGYRLGPAVEAIPGEPPASPTGGGSPPRRRAVRAAIALVGIAVAAAAVALLIDGSRWRTPPSPSVAVMPIETTSANADVQRIASGLGDALLTRLAEEASLRVPARTSVRAAAEHRADVRRVGRELGVEHVFEAVLDEAGGGYVVHASLVRSSDGFQEWARLFDVPDGGLAIAETAIADAVIAALDGHAGAPTSAIGTDSDQAYRAYLRGRALWHQRTEAALRWAIENDEAALAIDPQFARAHADLATAWMLLYEYSNLSLEDARRAAEPHVRAALRIAPDLAEAQAAHGLLLLDGGDVVAAEQALRKAASAAPNDATFLMWLGTSLTYQGRVTEAAAWHDKALALDPLSAVANVYVGVDRALAGDDSATARFVRAIALDPRLPESYWQYALAQRFAGRPTSARELLERALALDPSSEYTRAMLADTLLELHAPREA
ncbi:MAG TPA: winged helix-turn-helix domain-containing protein, partial [Dokdonella sp.]|nr:winged helix-turn-helix domain-containing protein [Dokdonella sp.]